MKLLRDSSEGLFFGSRFSRRRSQSNTFFIIAFVIAVALCVFFFARSSVSSFFTSLGVPLWNADPQESVSAAMQSLSTSKDSLIAQNRQLKEQLDTAQYHALEMQLAVQENGTHSASSSQVTARVLSRPNRSLYDTIVVAQGAARGVAVGDVALAGNSIAIGVVTSVTQTTALVALYSTPGKQTDVLLAKDSVVVVAEGQGGGGFIAKVPQSVPVEKGDIIALPNAKTIPFAVVDEIDVVPADPFKKVFFQNPVNMYTLSSVTFAKP